MSLNIPISSPLTESQSELTSKIGSMKNLLSLSIDTNFNIPKNKQISVFDYLIKILKTLGVDSDLIFNIFLDKIFDETGTFLEEKVLDAVADSIGEKGRKLPSTINLTATDIEKEEYKESNRKYLSGLIPPTFLQSNKQQIAKNLTIMIFGGGSAADSLNSSSSEINRLLEDAVCGENLFSVSSDPITIKEDIEFNRVKLKQQLEKGEVIFEVNCQKVKIILPKDPGYIFGEGGQFTSSSTLPPTPAQSLEILVQHVKNSGQRINNEENSNSIGKSFYQILITKFFNYISSLIFPFLDPVFSSISGDSAAIGIDHTNIVYSNCQIMNSEGDLNAKEQQSFFKSLTNSLLKELLRLLLIFAMKEFKRLIANYFTKTAIEKQKRKAEKIKQKFEIFNKLGQAAELASKAQKYTAAVSSLSGILGEIKA